MHLWEFFTRGTTLSSACYKFEKQGTESIFFFSLSFWMPPIPELQNTLSGLSVSGWLLTPGQPTQTPTNIHCLDSTFSNFLSIPLLVCSICSPLPWASGAMTPDYNTWLTLYSKFSSFLQRKKFSLMKSFLPPSFSAWKLNYEILHLLKKLVSESFTGPSACMCLRCLAIGTVVYRTL